MRTTHALFASVAAIALAMPAFAQDAPADDAAADEGEEIVVTAVAKGSNLLDTSVTVSSLSAELIANAAPRSVAELFRNIPGIRSESSGGEGNANIAVRGLPVASGGAKFLQLQEDGLPVLEFGDITFGNADIFLRADFNVARVESVRGGSASTFASNSPGGVINLISKTGEQEGGAVQASIGLDYNEYRADFDYGAAIGEDSFFHVGGFYRQGTGPRQVGYDGLKGGQIKANFTRKFDGGYIRFFGKYLNDKAVGYLPNPVLVTGTNADPNYSNLANFSITDDSLHSRFFTSARTLNGSNQPQSYDIRDGMRPKVAAVGFEGSIDLSDEWTLVDRVRYSDVKGGFISPFPGSIDTATNVATGIGGAGSVLTFANGPSAGQVVPGTTNVARIVLFNTRLNSLDNFTNDLRLNYSGEFSGGDLDVTLGFYASRQKVDTDWLWTSHLLEVRGGGNAALLNVRNAAGTTITDGGTVAYAASFFGNCCRRSYDLTYKTYAPFASITFKTGDLTLDGSVRGDFGQARGTTNGVELYEVVPANETAAQAAVRIAARVRPFDIDGNGTISAAEAKSAFFPNRTSPVNYNYDYTSYSAGANYRVSDSAALFARYSRGARANADRILFNNNNVSTISGGLRSDAVAIDYVTQYEGGVKLRSGGLNLFGTLFHATTQEQNFEATTQRTFDRAYKASGVELEGNYRIGGFSIRAGATYTDAEISRDSQNPAVQGKTPRRQAKFVYQLGGQYETDLFTIGSNLVGTSKSFAQDNNLLVLPGFTQVNAFVSVRPIERVQLSVNANNLFDVAGFTEAEEGAIPGNGIVRARSINGRTISAAVKFEF